ncbi:TPA: hypothetical protein DDW69_01820 [candidate division CPR2 bacterium]|uniref:Seg n=1 Tax=candidate division CPR2 bacterium GW2011_GWC1_41_48 TaxID=1618344 RepID=A0A0G0YJQ6_UNCC2|nr:MAG: HDIG domain protein [candidate division CPR2 bacterium GW2011_GWC2_39_35]KKR27457.1 MAG: HDIG domain protein [candidate division CPR2 bacterium GW2011_GWD1_39_7]KKR27466.1 MAG: HDIG domain protein [candidate division CPR2 bacterium GW2011_GWD2_39_7]KKS09761.1 MAG: seg [candidate division CPR2 bacterium GW2011_GWC1_41_48]OGB58827.1 MAG: hypothetical protein A2Y27_01835 [candidate division CPR2 bacterium GWD1_39_7]OGB71208.1 MAG: hypothetical protein A2Y26_00850 [candidate division CPR2 
MIPTKKQALKILDQYDLPEPVIKHSLLVCEVSDFIGQKMITNGQNVELEKLKAAAILLDLDKAIVGSDYKKHGHVAAQILSKKGMSEIAPLVKKHWVGNIGTSDLNPQTIEEKILFYADKITSTKIVSLEERGFSWLKKLPGKKDRILRNLSLVGKLEEEILSLAKITFKDIEQHFNS